jgi:hypothetical protein
MGSSNSKNSEEYTNFFKTIKEEVKSKSVYQYQIAHFKILSIEKKIVPTYEEIQSIKIKKIMTSKRLIDLKKTLFGLSNVHDESRDLLKLMHMQQKLEQGYYVFKHKHQTMLEQENTCKSKQKVLELLKNKLQSLKHKSQFLEMRQMKLDYSNQISKGFKSLGTNQKKTYSEFIIQQRIENCAKSLEKLDKLSLLSLNYRLDTYKQTISDTCSRIENLNQEKEKLLNLQKVDLVELNRITNYEGLFEDINKIKAENFMILEQNQELSKELDRVYFSAR